MGPGPGGRAGGGVGAGDVGKDEREKEKTGRRSGAPRYPLSPFPKEKETDERCYLFLSSSLRPDLIGHGEAVDKIK